MDKKNMMRMLPQMDRLVNDPDLRFDLPRETVINVLRQTIGTYRAGLSNGEINFPDEDALLADIKKTARQCLLARQEDRLRRVINATGVVLHTNLGRAPLAKTVMARVSELAAGYCNLEYDVAENKRSDRNHYVQDLLIALTGAEAALAVNNNAAAVFLTLNTLSAGREVIVSRGEIVEIGDSFRIMDIIENSGCIIRETGTTNHTRLSDYERCITEKTGVLLKVHRSNFKITGFTSDTGVRQLAELRDANVAQDIIVMEDMGSGLIPVLEEPLWGNERTVSDAIKEGADIVTFSGDKLLGGPQAGLIVGKKIWIDRMKRNPFYRCLRMDKLCLAALEATLQMYAYGDYKELPAMKALLEPLEQVRERTEQLAGVINGIPGLRVETGPHAAVPGGGARPGETIESWALYLQAEGVSASEFEQHLRKQPVPIISIVQHDIITMDMRTVDADDIPYIAQVIKAYFTAMPTLE